MTPALDRTSDTEFTLTFPADDRRGQTVYTIRYDPIFQRWSIVPPIHNRMMPKGHRRLDIVKRIVRYERLLRSNLNNADIEAQVEETHAYLRNGAAQ